MGQVCLLDTDHPPFDRYGNHLLYARFQHGQHATPQQLYPSSDGCIYAQSNLYPHHDSTLASPLFCKEKTPYRIHSLLGSDIWFRMLDLWCSRREKTFPGKESRYRIVRTSSGVRKLSHHSTLGYTYWKLD